MQNTLSWLEISRSHLRHNVQVFKKLAGKNRILCSAVKGNAYGHGLKECAPVIVEAGADWLCVNSLFEALTLKEIGIKVPIYIMGYIALKELKIAVQEGFHCIVYNFETLHQLVKICRQLKKSAYTHLKIETGTHRQGISETDLADFLVFYRNQPYVQLAGISTHFANIEDTTDHSYALFQLQHFQKTIHRIQAAGFHPAYIHCANTAATILFAATRFNMIRVGIGNYGLWPSKETYLSGLQQKNTIELQPVLTWKSSIVQIKEVPAECYIGYGCTYKTTYKSRLAILPVGYYDGYRRKLSNLGYVLIHGKRAPIRGRVFMNMVVADVTHIPNVHLEDEAVLLGHQGKEKITAELLASWMETIPYEVTTQISESLPRKVI